MNFQADPTEPQWHGYVYIIFLIGSQIIRSWALQHHYHRMNKLGVRIRAGVVAAIYRKVKISTWNLFGCYYVFEATNSILGFKFK